MDLQTELTKRAEMFNIYWQQYLLIKKPTMLYEAFQHLPSAGGKRIRPFLTMTSCESVSGEIQKALPLAA
jgi:geranylgeranyl diphosphate synthase type I